MFVLLFTLFVLIWIIFENFFILLILYFIWIIFLFILYFVFHIKYKKIILFWTISFLLTTLSIFSKNYIYSTHNYWLDEKYWIWTWTIIDTVSEWRYLFQDDKWRDFLYYSDNDYSIWEKLYTYYSIRNVPSISNFWSWENKFKSTYTLSFDYSKWIFMKWYKWTFYEKKAFPVWEWNISTINQTRKFLKERVIDLYWNNKYGWLLLWMLIWDKSQIPKKDYQDFIDSWLVHIIAVSGGNIIMIVVFLSFVLFFLPYYIRLSIIFLAISFYSLLCGLDSSVFRAWIMWSIWIITLFGWREIKIWRSMSYAYILMLIFNPYFLLYDIWFLMSFWALIWIVFIDRLFEKHKDKIWNIKVQKLLKWYLLPTIGASLWVFPIIIFFIWKMNILSILWNFVVIPIVPFVMIYGFISLFLFYVFPVDIILNIEIYCLKYIYLISEIVTKYGLYISIENFFIKTLIFFVFLWLFILIRFRFYK